LGIPLARYFWIQWRNRKIVARNGDRLERARLLVSDKDASLQNKIDYAHQFAAEKIIGHENLAYTTETDLIEQEDAEWQRRLDSGS
jgi:hypothetical protein